MRDEDNLMHSFQARLTDEGATLKQPVQPKKSCVCLEFSVARWAILGRATESNSENCFD